MVKFGSNLTKEAVDWVEKLTVSSDALMVMCQETLLLIDVGACSEMEGHSCTCPGPTLSWIISPTVLPRSPQA